MVAPRLLRPGPRPGRDNRAGALAQAAATQATPLGAWWAGERAPPANARMLQEDIGPGMTVVEIPGAGHALLPEQPEAVATAVIDCIRAR